MGFGFMEIDYSPPANQLRCRFLELHPGEPITARRTDPGLIVDMELFTRSANDGKQQLELDFEMKRAYFEEVYSGTKRFSGIVSDNLLAQNHPGQKTLALGNIAHTGYARTYVHQLLTTFHADKLFPGMRTKR